MRKYRGYEIRTVKAARRNYFELWKDGQTWGFTDNYLDAEILIDRILDRKN